MAKSSKLKKRSGLASIKSGALGYIAVFIGAVILTAFGVVVYNTRESAEASPGSTFYQSRDGKYRMMGCKMGGYPYRVKIIFTKPASAPNYTYKVTAKGQSLRDNRRITTTPTGSGWYQGFVSQLSPQVKINNAGNAGGTIQASIGGDRGGWRSGVQNYNQISRWKNC